MSIEIKTVDNLKFREADNTASDILAVIPKGASLSATNEDKAKIGNGKLWIKTTYADKIGYVNAFYVVFVRDVPEAPAPPDYNPNPPEPPSGRVVSEEHHFAVVDGLTAAIDKLQKSLDEQEPTIRALVARLQRIHNESDI